MSQPWTTIGAAVAAAAPNAIVAIGPGTYVETVEIKTKPLRLWGKCPDEVAMVATGNQAIKFDHQTGEVHRLKISGTRGVRTYGDAVVLIEEVWIDDCDHAIEAVSTTSVTPETTIRRSLISNSTNRGIYGIGGAITLEESVIRDTNPDGLVNASQGIEHSDMTVSTGLGELTVRRSLMERGRLHAIQTTGVNVVLEDLVIQDIEPTNQPLEAAIYLVGSLLSEQLASLDADRLYLERVGGGGMRLFDMNADIEVLVVKDTAPTIDNVEGGQALDVSTIGIAGGVVRSVAKLRFATIDRVQSRAIMAIGGIVHLEAVRIRDVSPWFDGTAGQGLLLQEAFDLWLPAGGSVNGLVVERAHEAGIAISGAMVPVEGALVLDTRERPTGGFGRGIVVQDDLESSFGTTVTLSRSWVHGASEAGVGTLGGELEIQDVRVDDVSAGGLDGGACFNFQPRPGLAGSVSVSGAHGEGCEGFGMLFFDTPGTASNVHLSDISALNDQFGDGVTVVVAPVDLTTMLIAGARRAGTATFGAALSLQDVVVDCNPIDINGESHGMASYGVDDRGGNRCGCGAEERDCKVQSAGLEPPAPLEQ